LQLEGTGVELPAGALPLAGPLPGAPGLLDPPPLFGAPAPPVGLGAVEAPCAGSLPEAPESSATDVLECVGCGSMAPEQATANAVPQAR
jgi:hypothetical protein